MPPQDAPPPERPHPLSYAPVRSGRHRWWVVFVVVLFAALVLVPLVDLILFPSTSRPSASMLRTWCKSNLEKIGREVRMYSWEHGAPPVSFQYLLDHTDLGPEPFVCPHSNDVPALTPEERLGGLAFNTNLSYLILPVSGQMNPSTTILALERPWNHNHTGAHVLYADGSVKFLSMSELKEATAAIRIRERWPDNVDIENFLADRSPP